MNYNDEKIVAKVPPESEEKCGERISVYFDTEKLYFFDADTEKRIEC